MPKFTIELFLYQCDRCGEEVEVREVDNEPDGWSVEDDADVVLCPECVG